MNSWLRNIQGHLSEFASEVLSEAIEEVNDPESELQVAKKKISEMEKELTAQQGIVQQLEKKINNFEDDLYAKNLEVDTLNARYSSAIESRDSQIRSLQAELEQMHHASPEAYSDADDDGLFLASGARLARMKDEIEQLRKEVAHWKRFVNEQPKESDAKKISELERILVEQKTKYEDEVAALVAAHKATVDELKFNQEECQDNESKSKFGGFTSEEYDSEIAALKEEIRSLSEERNLLLTKIKLEQEENAVQEDQVDILTFQALDKVLSERYGRIENEYAMLKEKLDNAQKEVADKGVEIENLQQTINEMRISEISLKDEKRNQELMMAETIRQLKMEIKNWEQKFEISEKKSNEQLSQANQKLFTLETRNNEFATAFGELNAEFQNYKADHDSLATSNHLLLTRIDTLEAVLTLYEKQYKMCKAENASTVDRPVKLSDEFEKLRMSFDISKSNNELDVIDEVDMLRTELEASKRDRERLRDGVEHFRLAVVSVEDELNGLRESNNKLTKENKAMSVSLDEFKGIRNMLETSGSELKILREKFSQLQNEHKLKEKQWREQLLELSEIRDDAKRQLEERQRETSLRQIRSADATLPAEMVESKSDEGKTASSEGTADSNNGWEKLMDWDVTTVGLSSSSFMNNSTIANQLREALAAGAEKSEECEELRRQNCEMNKKAKELKNQNLQLEQIISATEQKLAELQGQLEISESNRKKDELKNMEEINSLQHAVGNYEQKIKQQKEAHEEALHRTQSQHKYEIQDLEMKWKLAQDELLKLRKEYDAKEEFEIETKKSIEMVYKKDVERATIRQNELERKNRELQQKLDETATQLEELERVGAEHISKLQKLELQCSDYKMQLQNVSCELEQLSLTAAAATERALCLDRDLKNSTKSREKVMRDCERLRSHLMNVEETSVKEAKSAEEREMELRKRIRTLEQKAEESVDNIIESTSAYKRQISELTEELNLIRNEKQTITERLRERENALADTKMALSNLQNVLRDIAIDHEGQMAQHQNTTTELKKNIDDLKREMYELRQTQVTMEQEKQLLENRTEQLKEEVCKKDMLIEELETSLDERAQAVKPSTSSHIVDDQVLRQLFLSYFTADKDKQPEIAVLLASVLGYSQEDVAKINSAVNSSSRGWFSFGSSSKPQPSISLAEQFVRFLEKESAVTPHSLPVQPADEKETIRSSNVPLRHSGPSSITDLRSILNT